jgi:uncharacterized protein
MEHKTLLLSDCEIKLDVDAGTFSGYASTFNNVDSYGDTILPGAYKETLSKNGLPKMFILHRSFDLPVGKWLDADEDHKGLWVKGELTPGMTMANDVGAAMRHGTLDGLSIGYALKKGDYAPSDKVEGGRIIKKVSVLAEISPVTFPADKKARINLSSIKSELEEVVTVRDLEYFLRDAGGFSKSVTEAIIAKAKQVHAKGDPSQGTLEEAVRQIKSRLDRFQVPNL